MMMKMSIIPIFIALSLLSLTSVKSIEFDFCVADPNPAHGPDGFACKDPSKATTDDFVYSGLRTPGNTSNHFKAGTSNAFLNQFHGLNGLGISMMRVDLDVGGLVSMHNHPVAELLFVVDGSVGVGFIGSNNKLYYNVIEKGDLKIIPRSLQHFVINVGKTPAVLHGTFPASHPGANVMTSSLFRNNLPTEIVGKATMLDVDQIMKLKKIYGGTN